MYEEFEIYFNDLTDEAKKKYLEFQRVTSERELNHEFFPIAVVGVEHDDE